MSATAFQRMRREKEIKRLKEIETEEVKELKGLKVVEIKELLDEKGIEYDPKSKREDLVKLLEGAE